MVCFVTFLNYLKYFESHGHVLDILTVLDIGCVLNSECVSDIGCVLKSECVLEVGCVFVNVRYMGNITFFKFFIITNKCTVML